MSKEGKSKSKRERWAREKKNDNPEGSTPSYNIGLYGEARPWKGFLTQVSGMQALLGALAVRREKEGELVTMSLEFEFHLQFPCGSPLTELSDFGQSAPSGNERQCKQTLKNTWKHAPIVMTSFLMSFPSISISHRLSRCRDVQISET